MNCPNCAAVMVTARATDFGSEYFYCRACKKELCEMVTLEARVQEPESFSDAFKGYFRSSVGSTTSNVGNITYDPTPITFGGIGSYRGSKFTQQCGDPDCSCMLPASDPDDTDPTAGMKKAYIAETKRRMASLRLS